MAGICKNNRRIKMCFKLILEKKHSDVVSLLKANCCQNSSIGPGIKFAIDGIINFTREIDTYDLENLKKLRKFLKSRLSVTWNDDFDRDYFWTWINFINFLQRQTRSDG